ncbi:MAG: protein kinase [Tannerellaceae bacterium]|jgi:serine/threonine-protein kinase|nr:protein kinase [Tannerellaceae bacterium]
MHLPEGYTLQDGKYRIDTVVGQGGFGITYRGVWRTVVKGSLGSTATEVPVAIKEYFFRDYCSRGTDGFEVQVHSATGEELFGKFKEKLLAEARILSAVQHKYIVGVLEVFEENHTAYIVMEYIKGCSLKEKIEKDGRLPEAVALRYIGQIGEALSFVHERQIIHLDIKPSNILIDERDNARLIDFGVSKRFDFPEEVTSTTILALSKGFAAIEQYDSEGTLEFSALPDIYSLGATLYYAVTGQVPTESILRATRELIDPRQFNPDLSIDTTRLILHAMETVPEKRFGSVKEMLRMSEEEVKEVTAGRQESLSAEEETVVLRVKKESVATGKEALPTKRKAYITMAGAIVAALVLFVFFILLIRMNTTAKEKKEEVVHTDTKTNHDAPPSEGDTSTTEEVAPVNPVHDNTPTQEDISTAYEVKKIAFGRLRIVKKRSIGLYGAIDADGKERIPCKYLYNDSAPEGRAFARVDGLFDIYNDEGILLRKGVKTY